MARKSSNKNTPEKSSIYKSYVEKLENQVETNQSKLSMILGALIILVVGILIFNYFSKSRPDLGPAQQTEEMADVSPQALPGQYTVKEGDTLFLIAEKYYLNGEKYPEIAQANNLTNVDQIEVGQVLQIPKLETPETATGGGTTIWGPRIEGNSYTIIEGDWLSKIAGRAYGDIYAYDKIAKANNIQNPDLIEPGMVLVIPR